ncbi:tyrosine-type recombinase/integrase [Solibacillus sp. FSL H8-0538]|uniref:tyrosine-type recombinase/integrase n=1 Tax=Solibacillus sp. FSL H8-0538 TaxID=2921400 RepID=UPI0030FC68C5
MTRVQPIRDKELLSKFKRFFQEKNERDFIMFLVGTQCGFRISDILPLRVKDVLGWDIIVYEKKTDKYREVRMPPELKKAVRKYVDGKSKDEFLFKSRKGKNQPITRKRAYEILREAAEYFDLERVGTHTLRKTYGYHHYKKFKNIAMLQETLNHNNPSDTLIYIGIIQDELNALQSKVDW